MQNRTIVASVLLVALGCGHRVAERATPALQGTSGADETIVVPDPEAEPEPEPDSVSWLTAEQREALAPEVEALGWTLSEFEQRYRVYATAIPNGYEVVFVNRGPSGVFARSRIEIGGAFTGGTFQLPEGPELTLEQRNLADEALREAGELWLLGSDSECSRLDLSQGLTAIVEQDTSRTRYHIGRAVLMVADGDRDHSFVVVINLPDGRILEAREHSLAPENASGMLRPAEVTFIDHALREQGSIGVFIDFSQGFRALVENRRVLISRESDRYNVSIRANDGREFIRLHVNRRTGAIDDWAVRNLRRR